MVIFGEHDDKTIEQLKNCLAVEDDSLGVLCADGHVGYSCPIGGVLAYRGLISPSGVGYDIACGNYAVKTNLNIRDVTEQDLSGWADEIARRVSFGIGRSNDEKIDDPVIDDINKAMVPQQRALTQLAANQLGTVGSGNHYVDVFEDSDGTIWIGVHFGSRGFGHKTANMFMNAAKGLPLDSKPSDGEMMSPPLVLTVDSSVGEDYIEAMNLAGAYAYAGRRAVVNKVLEILGAQNVWDVHNHHNFAWSEKHFGEMFWVIRKGATPAFPGQYGFVGGSMGDMSVILQGKESETSQQALYSTVHGAGRVMSRNQATKGKHQWVCPTVDADGNNPCGVSFIPPQQKQPKDNKCPVCRMQLVKTQLTAPINFRDVQDLIKEYGVQLRGAGPDESPQVYRRLPDVLLAHANTINVLHVLRPRIVVMAGRDIIDPYKE